MKPPDFLVSGPLEHGVVRYARELANATITAYAAQQWRASRPRLLESPSEFRVGHPVHVHFTDQLFGLSPEDAAASFERLAESTPVSVTVHDVPQASDGAANLPRRRDCYRRVLAAARGAVCNSFHEVALLQELDILTADGEPAVIPLAADLPPQGEIGPDKLDAVAALVGFIYPGKGHREVIDATARMGGILDVIALGAASVGHEADLVALTTYAKSLGITFTSTGYISDDELHHLCRRAAVPIAAHQHLSASASILSWLSAGRRPLVVESRYSREMQTLRPGTMTLYAPNSMEDAIATAVANPQSTFLNVHINCAPHLPDVVKSYISWWEGVDW